MPESGQPAPAWPTQPVEDASEPAVAAGEGAQVGWPSADDDGASPAWPSDDSAASPDGVKVAAEEPAADEAESDIEDEAGGQSEPASEPEPEVAAAVEEQDTAPVAEPATQQVPVPVPVKQPEPVKQSEPVKEPEAVRQSEPVKEPELVKQPEPVKEPELVREPDPVKEPEAVREPVTQQVPVPVKDPVPVKPPVAKPTPVAVQQPVEEPPTQQVPVPKPAPEPTGEPPTQQVPVPKPLSEPASEPVTQAVPEPVEEPATQPVPEPATQRVPVPPPPAVIQRLQPPKPPAPPQQPVTRRVPPPPRPKIQPRQPVPPPKPVSKEPETLRFRLTDLPPKTEPTRIEPPVSPLEDTVAMPVDNDRARLDPPTVQLPSPGMPAGDDTPTIRVQVPRPPAAGRPELGDDVPQPAPQLPPPPRTSPETDIDEPAPRRSRKPLLVGLAIVLVLAVGAAVYFGSSGLGGTTVVATAPPPSPAAPNLLIKPLGDGPAPTAAGIAAKLAGPVSSPALGTLTGSVVDPATGTTLWDRNSSTPLTPASAGKLLTMTAALLSLDPQFRFTTTVVAGPDPDTVVLVGGGDPTLSSLPAGKETVYPGAARLDDLVAQVKQATGGAVHKVLLDTSRYSGDAMAPGWENGDIAGGSVAPITPIMLDGGRSRPTVSEPPRTATPDTDAAKEFAKRLGADPNSVAKGAAAPDAKVLGTVQSPPLTDMVSNLLQISDNVLAEAIGREVAKQAGAPVTFAGGASTVLNILRNNNFDLTGVTMADGSGLSTQDRVTAKLLSSIMTVAAGPDGGSDPRVAKLRPLLNGLPVAGGSGTLSDRYGDASSAPGKGWVRAKTGTLDGVNTLAGIVQTTDGKVLAFALMSNGSQIEQGRAALDNVAAALRGCGCR